LERGIFAIPAIYPAVPQGRTVIRTAFTATHEEHPIDFVLETMYGLSKNRRSRAEEAHSLQSLNMFSNCQ
jgi:glycine C-acetyltransferase